MNPLDSPHHAQLSTEDLHLAYKRSPDATERQRIDLELTKRRLRGVDVIQDPEWASVKESPAHPPRPEEPKVR